VVRVRDQPRAGAEDRQRVDLDVRVLRRDVDLEEMVMLMHFFQKQSCYQEIGLHVLMVYFELF
jgi:hypothetical protein